MELRFNFADKILLEGLWVPVSDLSYHAILSTTQMNYYMLKISVQYNNASYPVYKLFAFIQFTNRLF